MAKKKFTLRPCENCNNILGIKDYLPTSSPFFIDGHTTICVKCIAAMIEDGHDWRALDKICQWADWPFLPAEWTRLYTSFGVEGIAQYARLFFEQTYNQNVNWEDTNRKWLSLQEEKELDDAHPEISEAEYIKSQQWWGGGYTAEELHYLDDFFKNLEVMYPIAPGLQTDQAKKLCKISLLIDNTIRGGDDIRNLMNGYKELITIGGFAPKNAKNAQDFDSISELFSYLEKTNYLNQFHTGTPKDIVDKTIQNIQSYNRRLILGETNIQDQANDKLLAFIRAQEQEQELTEDIHEIDGYDPAKAHLDIESEQLYEYSVLEDEDIEEFNPGEI